MMQRRHRVLRLVASAICLTMCAVLIVFWVRSYRVMDSARKGDRIEWASYRGEVYFFDGRWPWAGPVMFPRWEFGMRPVECITPHNGREPWAMNPYSRGVIRGSAWHVSVPYALLVAVIGVTGVVAARGHYNLRMLLTCVTLMAGLFGLLAFAN
jgi:hypothetical protein